MRVTVLGVGLVGGSVALAARRRLGAHVTGWDLDPGTIGRALLDGVLDDHADTARDAAAGADVVVAATPPAALPEVVAAALAAGGDAVVSDVGSTKAALVERVDAPRFVGGHPLAGGEASGLDHAREDLFDGATWYLTPRATASGVHLERLHRFVSSLGAAPAIADAATHDRVLAAVSHLPHLLANVLVERAAEALGGESLPPTGPSFRDATRVAGANPQMWGQVYAQNGPAIRAELDGVIARLAELRDRLEDLEPWQREVAGLRARFAASLAGPTEEVRVRVPNRPGVVADLALTLSGAGINIADMSLTPSPDQTTGQVALWVPAADAARARELVAPIGALA